MLDASSTTARMIMKRRHFLGSLAGLAATVTSGFVPAASASPSTGVARDALAASAIGDGAATATPAGAMLYRRVRPADAAWPRAAQWSRLREAVGGNLIEGRALFAACAAAPDGGACREALAHIGNPYWIGDQDGGTEVSGWLDAWTPAPSAYAVKARDARDVAAAVDFARAHRLRLVVKGGGHSYQGTSNAPDSLLVWTRAMNRVALVDAFVGAGCAGKAAPVPAVTVGAGALWMDLYHAVTTQGGRYVQGGGCTTVGVAGLVQSGGFNCFSKRYGSAAASLLEAEIVTADGQVRVVNACQDSELFWALKGGGGGSFGVVTRLTLRTHDLPPEFGGAWGTVKAQSDAAYARLIAQFLQFYAEALYNPHWGEHVHFRADNVFEIDMVCQGLDGDRARQAWQPFFDWVAAAPNDYLMLTPFGVGTRPARQWWDLAHNREMTRDTRAGAPAHHAWGQGDQGEVGVYLHGYDSLWLPAALLQAPRQRELADAVFAASRHQMVRFHLGKGLGGAAPEAVAAARQTATNPAMLDAFTLVIIADGERPPAYPGLARPAIDLARARADARAIDAAAAALRAIAPNAGSYVSESNYFNAGWQSEFWGENYARLRAIKARVDPDGLFFVHHGVGSEQWSADGFSRVA